MKITYIEHYNKLISEYGVDNGEIEYKKFLRSSTLKTYIIKYGEIEGEKRYKNKKKTGSSLKKMIDLYGDVIGKKKYENWKKLSRQSKQSFINRYGKKIGEIKYNEFRLKCVIKKEFLEDVDSKYNNRKHNTRIGYYLDECDGDYDRAKKMLYDRQNTSSKDKFIKKYGLKNGLIKYQKINKLKSITLNNFIRLYGDIEGSERWENYKNKLKYSHSIKYYIDKYGEDDGRKKWNNIIIKKFNNFSFRSKIGDEFCFKLFKMLKINNINDNFYFSENEYMFFVHNDNFNIILPDFYMKNNFIVVEFYGDYWHRNPKIYKDKISNDIRNKDHERIKKIKELGNSVIIVWESDYLYNKQEIILETFNNIEKIINKNENSRIK